MAATVAIVNQKGGVGKTTVTLGLASAARHAGHRVLVVDLDPQASATWVLGIEPDEVVTSTAELLAHARSGAAAKAVVASGWGDQVDVLPASARLHGQESGRAATHLRTALEGVAAGYAAVLIDCAPSLGNLTVNGLTAADLALVVVEPAALGLRGITAVADAVDDIWDRHNPRLDLAGVIVNRLPAVSAEAGRRYEELGRIVGRKAVWQPPVPQRVVVTQAAAERRPIHDLGWKGADVALVFDHLWAKLRRTIRG